MTNTDLVSAYASLMRAERRRLWLARRTVYPNGTLTFSAAYVEWLRVQGIVFPAPPKLRPPILKP